MPAYADVRAAWQQNFDALRRARLRAESAADGAAAEDALSDEGIARRLARRRAMLDDPEQE